MSDLDPEAQEFYKQVINILNKAKLPFLVGGTFAVRLYTGIERETKDIDFFCKASDYPKILATLKQEGFKTEVTDERWLAKATKGKYFVDFIFSSGNIIHPVDSNWFIDTPKAKLYGLSVNLIPLQYLIWSKMFVQDRYKYDGADVSHLILKQHEKIDWDILINQMDPYWEVLFQHLLFFRFIYPSERGVVPKKIMRTLQERLESQLETPIPKDKVCRGRLFSRHDFEDDVKKWGYAGISESYTKE
jgi:hypothetical protein